MQVAGAHGRSRHPIPTSDLANVTVKVIGRFSERLNAIQGKLPELEVATIDLGGNQRPKNLS